MNIPRSISLAGILIWFSSSIIFIVAAFLFAGYSEDDITNHTFIVVIVMLAIMSLVLKFAEYRIFDVLTMVSFAIGFVILWLFCFGNWEVQLNNPPVDCWPHLVPEQYHHGEIYTIDPIWMCSFTFILPIIWLKRRIIKACSNNRSAGRTITT